MKGVIKSHDGKDGWDYLEVDNIEPKNDEVEIEVQAAGICGSELHLYHDNHVYDPPVIVGHEFCGIVSRVGPNVKYYKVGDRVVSENNKRTCGVCEFCRTGRSILCRERKSVGYKVNGGWTQYFCTPEKWLLRIPDNVSYEEAAMTEPVSVATQALFVKKTVTYGDVVLVQGCGVIGIINAIVAKILGASTVIITGTKEDEKVRLPIARKVGIEHVLNIEETDLKKYIMDLTSGKGADVIVEASGSKQAIYDMSDIIRKTGTIVVIGETSQKDIPIRWTDLVFKAVTLHFCFGNGFEAWSLALKLMEEKTLHLDSLITHRIPLQEFRKGFDLLDNKEALKVILSPGIEE